MNKKRAKLREANCYDDIKIRVIDRFREQDPMTLSNSELRSAIDYMLAYRWALNGDEQVLHEYIEVSKLRNKNKNESKNMNNKLIRLTESDLHRIVKESVKKVLNERTFGDEIMKKPYLDLMDAVNNFDNVVHQLYYEKDMNKLQDFGAGQKRVEDLLQRYNDALRAYRFACEDFVRHEDSNRPWWERENIYT
ncbi:MAG: hypothetical protein IKI06_01550 [Prevotella sp.]|nr:hypothetical protein [Prevotella sp.]